MTRYDPSFELALPRDLHVGSEPAAAIRTALSLPELLRFQGARCALFIGAVLLSQAEGARESAPTGLDRALEGYVCLQRVLSGRVDGLDLHPEAMAILTAVIPDHPPTVQAMEVYRAELDGAALQLRGGAACETGLFDRVMSTAYRESHPAMVALSARMVEAGADTRARAEAAARAAQARAPASREQIADIARTVRLISLDARVEAARAGDSGRAFGVIANEIKTLSEQTEAVSLDMRASVDEITARFRAI